MFRFENPYHLLVWIGIPLLLGLFFGALNRREKALSLWGEESLLRRIAPGYSAKRRWVRLGLLALALLFLGLSYANPQWGLKREKVERKGSDIFIALDISRSMNAEDLAPSRLERAKKFARKLVGKLQGERIGVILFAGQAYIQSPLTIDYSSADQFIDAANPKQVLTQGTSIASALSLANQSFGGEEGQHKAIIVISDGENHEPLAIERAEQLHKDGLLVFTVGAGTEEGGYIPVKSGGYSGYKRDSKGELVRSKINEEMLQKVAAAGGGTYYNILSGEDAVLAALDREIEKIEKREFEERMFEEYESYFWIFAIPAFLLLAFDFFWPNRRLSAA